MHGALTSDPPGLSVVMMTHDWSPCHTARCLAERCHRKHCSLAPLLGSIYYHKVFQKQLCRPQWKEHIVDGCPIIHSAGRDSGGTLSAEPAEQVSQI